MYFWRSSCFAGRLRIHEKQDVIETPIMSGAALAYLSRSAAGQDDSLIGITPRILSRSDTETEVIFHYTFTDANGVVYTQMA